MKLEKVAIQRYRSIDDLTEISVEPDITCLVGKNESGKTAVLEALFKTNSHDGSAFEIGNDYPITRTDERRENGEGMTVTCLTFKLEPLDLGAIEDELGPESLLSQTVVVETNYAGDKTIIAKLDEQAVVKHVSGDLDPSIQKAVGSLKTVSDLLEAVNSLEDPAAEAGAAGIRTRVENWRDSDPMLALVDIINERLPKFLYFADYDVMPTDIDLTELYRASMSGELDRGDRAFLSLLTLAGVELNSFTQPESVEHLRRDVEDAATKITTQLFSYWSQNRDLRIKLDTTPGSSRGMGLQVRVENLQTHASLAFRERSRGFVWFFSFLAYFSGVKKESSQPLILLLDEPGLSLHGKAQQDLLRFIDERLATEHQVLFTTHSPFMVDPKKLERVRTVEYREQGGTTVSEDILAAEGETVLPLMAAMGVELTQTLWVGPYVLLVEGPSDVVFLNYLSELLIEEGKQGLDPKWVVTPGGGLSKLPSFQSLFGANKMHVGVVADSSKRDAQTMQRLKETGSLYNTGVVLIGDIVNKNEADLEDIFNDGFYLELVNAAYKGALKNSQIRARDLPRGERLTKRVEEYFARHDINNGRLNHFSPAKALLNGAANNKKPVQSAIDKAEELIAALNALLPAE